jgi:hypothetical protein
MKNVRTMEAPMVNIRGTSAQSARHEDPCPSLGVDL